MDSFKRLKIMCTGGQAHGALCQTISIALELEEFHGDIGGRKQGWTPWVADCLCGVCKPEREQVR